MLRAFALTGSMAFIAALAAVGCENDTDNTANVLPGSAPDADAGGTLDIAPPPLGGDGDAAGQPFTGAFLFNKLIIKQIASQRRGDPLAIQLNLLEQQWAVDIEEYKLNIMLLIDSMDPDGGEALMRVGSGIGTGKTDQCVEPTSASVQFPGTAEGSKLAFDLGADPIYIYAQDNDGTSFNCTPDEARPDAVPLRAVLGEATLSEDRTTATGRIEGCLGTQEALELCSCLGKCSGTKPHKDCPGCPPGAIPLGTLLGGITPSPECEARTGKEGFLIVVEFESGYIGAPPGLCP